MNLTSSRRVFIQDIKMDHNSASHLVFFFKKTILSFNIEKNEFQKKLLAFSFISPFFISVAQFPYF